MTQTRNPTTKVADDLKHVNTANPSAAASSSAATCDSTLASKSQELHKKIDALTSKLEEASRKSDILVSEATSTTTAKTTASAQSNDDTNPAESVEETDELRKRRLQHFSSANSPVPKQ